MSAVHRSTQSSNNEILKRKKLSCWKEAKEMNKKKARKKPHQQQYCNGNDTRLLLNKELCVFSVLRLRLRLRVCTEQKKQKSVYQQPNIGSEHLDGKSCRIENINQYIYIRQSSAYSVCGALLYLLLYLTYRNCYLILVLVFLFCQCAHTIRIESMVWKI